MRMVWLELRPRGGYVLKQMRAPARMECAVPVWKDLAGAVGGP